MRTEKDIFGRALYFTMGKQDKLYDTPKRQEGNSLDSRTFLRKEKDKRVNKKYQKVDYPDKIAGSVLGFAIGDAIGAPLEFLNSANEVKGYEPSFRKGLKAGQYTDDTQHLEIGLDSIIGSLGDIDLEPHAGKLVEWYKSGDARSMGRTTESAIKNLIAGKEYNQSGIDHINSCGSLAIARLIPYSLLSSINRYKHKLAQRDIRKILGVTHAHKKVFHMGNLFDYFIQEIMNGKTPKETLDMILFENNFLNKRIRRKLEKVRDLSESRRDPSEVIQELGTGGFVEEIVLTSIYATLRGNSFEEAVLISANGRGDTDSRAAFTGALYGLDIGASKIPPSLKDQLERSKELEKKARQIYYLRK